MNPGATRFVGMSVVVSEEENRELEIFWRLRKHVIAVTSWSPAQLGAGREGTAPLVAEWAVH